MRTRWSQFVIGAMMTVLVGGAFAVRAQTPDTTQLRAQLEERYDLVPLQNGIALTPKNAGGTVRFIEVRDGVVSINGEAASARDLRQRLGADDADLVLRVTYLDAAAAKALAAPAPAAESDRDRDLRVTRTERPDSDGERSQTRLGDIVRIGGSITVAKNESVDGDVIAIGGSTDIDGEVRGEVMTVGGSVNLGPDAHVHRDVTVILGPLIRASGARIDGKVDEIGMYGPSGPFPFRVGDRPWPAFWRFGGLFATLLRVTLLGLGVLVVTALGQRYVESISGRTAADPVPAGITGLLAEVLFIPVLVITCVVLAVSIIGIPLLILVPFAIVLTMVLMLVGFTGVAHRVGTWIAGRLGVGGGVYAQVLLGVAAIVGITIVARLVGLLEGFGIGFLSGAVLAVGMLVEYAAWTVGAGALILTWYGTRRKPSTAPAGPPTTASEAPAQ
jgi:hypothetical protein